MTQEQIDLRNRATEIAYAFTKIASVDNYLVGFVGEVSLEELEEAEQILISWSNSEDNKNDITEYALDLIQYEIKDLR